MSRVVTKQAIKSFSKKISYLLYIPEGYVVKSKQMWPLIVFLHGAGERGDDLELVKLHGPPKLIEAGRKMPFVVVSPQLPIGEWWSPDMVAWLVNDILGALNVDPDRVYLTGLSMGGYGTWETASKYPELFAAIAPICGRGDPTVYWKLRYISTWIFHGAKDTVVPIKHSYDMNKALKQYGNVKYTVYPEADHDSWTETYLNEELYSWFLSHKRFRYPEFYEPENPEKYVGRYSSKENLAEFSLKDGILYIALETSGNKERARTNNYPKIFVYERFAYYLRVK